MAITFNSSQTKINLMRAFAGESQARNRYTFAASQAKTAKLHVIEAIFSFTADQEKEHGEIFYQHLAQLAGETIHIDGDYPVNLTDSVLQLLRYAQQNEYEEHDHVYQDFARIAMEEGFPSVADSFARIAEIEKVHGDRFGFFADLLENNKLFVSEFQCQWMCLNCGYVFEGNAAPQKCPVCQHDQGFFLRLELAPYTKET